MNNGKCKEKHFVLKFKLEIFMKKIYALVLLTLSVGFGQDSDNENLAKHRRMGI